MKNNEILYIFIHKDKIIRITKKCYVIEIDETMNVLIPKSICYKLDELCNIIKIGLIKKIDYKIEYPNAYDVTNSNFSLSRDDLWKELYNNNKKYNQNNKVKELIGVW